MDKSASIGVFDSGVGGLSVLKELVGQLPNESFIYVADSANAPYGTKSRNFIRNRSRAITRFLLSEGAKVIVVACNTATGAAISVLRKEFDVSFIGVEPAVKPAAIDSSTGHIGILATSQTFKGEHFRRAIKLYAGSVELHVQAGTGLVELIEAGKTNSEETRQLLRKYLLPMVEKGIDQLVLGCTHYPFLIPEIRDIVPDNVRIIDPSPAVARQTLRVLRAANGCQDDFAQPVYRFYTSGNPQALSLTITHLMGSTYPVEKMIDTAV
jgi:glutamate racemase